MGWFRKKSSDELWQEAHEDPSGERRRFVRTGYFVIITVALGFLVSVASVVTAAVVAIWYMLKQF